MSRRLHERAIDWMQLLGRKPVGHLFFSYAQPGLKRESTAVEVAIGCPIPLELKRLFDDVACKFKFSWWMSDRDDVPDQFRLRGQLEWDLYRTKHLRKELLSYCTGTVFAPIWESMFPFAEGTNGELFALGSIDHHVYHLRPAEPPDCAIKIGNDLFSFLDDFMKIGCIDPGSVSAESLRQFWDPVARQIQPNSPWAQEWRRWVEA